MTSTFVVTHSEAGSRALPTLGGALSVRRRVAGFLLALGGLPLLTWVLSLFRSDESLASDVLAFQLFIVIVALVGGIWPAVATAVIASLVLDFFFVAPLYVTIADPLHLLALIIFVVVAVLVSTVVDQAARRCRLASRAAANRKPSPTSPAVS